MSDLSGLNPTPHAIAVYASQPLSPVVTQHSLPSGRYALLGPDFHRLDRTSLRLAHLFDHLVGDCEKRLDGLLSAYKRTHAPQQAKPKVEACSFPHGVGLSNISRLSDRRFLGSIHNPRQSDREGRATS